MVKEERLEEKGKAVTAATFVELFNDTVTMEIIQCQMAGQLMTLLKF